MDKDNTINYKYLCEKCNYNTNSASAFWKHKKSVQHLNLERKPRKDKVITEPFKCEKCNFESTKEINYKSHMLNNHLTKEEREKEFLFYCKTCDFGVFTKSCYDKHIETKKHKMKSA